MLPNPAILFPVVASNNCNNKASEPLVVKVYSIKLLPSNAHLLAILNLVASSMLIHADILNAESLLPSPKDRLSLSATDI